MAQTFSAALNAATTTVSHHAAHPACPHSAQGLWAAPNLQGHFVHGLRSQNTMGSCKESAALRWMSNPGHGDAHGHMQQGGHLAVPALTPPGPGEIEELKISVSFLTPYFKPRDK